MNNITQHLNRQPKGDISFLCKRLELSKSVKTVTISNKLLSMTFSQIVGISKDVRVLNSDSFWKALFMDQSYGLASILNRVSINDNMREYYSDSSPFSHEKDMRGEKHYVYRFWEKLYAEAEIIMQSEDACIAVQHIANERGYRQGKLSDRDFKVLSGLLEYPFISLFFGVRYASFRSVIILNDSDLYRYLPPPKSMGSVKWELRPSSFP